MASAATVRTTPEVRFAGLDALSGKAGEDLSLLRMRRHAAASLAPLLLPDRARHLWRYTDPLRFLPRVDPTTQPEGGAAVPWRFDEELAAAANLVEDRLVAIEIDDATRRAGVIVEDLHRARTDGLLGSLVGASYGFVEAINTAAWQGGILVRVPRGVALETPIRLRFDAGARAVSLPRVLVIAGEGSSFEVIEGHVGGGAGTQVLGVTELLVGAGASVRFDLVQRLDEAATGHLTARARLDSGARFQLALASFGAKLLKADVGTILAGEGAEAELYGVAMGSDTQHLDHHTEHIHEAGKTHSNLDFKIALTAASRSVYTGMIRIAEHAGGSEAYQENRNLLLSEDARAESIPELEISTDDVRCSHGATVAPLDEEQLFYLLSRGLPRNQATRLIVYGFLDQTLQRLPRATRERIEALVAARLHTD